VLVVALFLFFAFGGHEHEPVCNGKTLSQWAMIRSASVGTVLRHTGGQVEGIVWTETIARSHLANAEAAIRHIGTNGLPFMLDWLVYESPALRPTWKQKAIDWLTKIPMPKKFKAGLRNTSFNAYPEQPPRPMPEDALWCFQVLGSKAGPAIPALTKIALEREHWQASVRGIEALDAIGQESTPALLDLATNYACSSRRQVIVALTELAKRNPGSEIGAISRTLARCVNDGDIAIERQAARSLGDLKVDQTIAFPVLTNGLRDPNLAYACLGALGEYGPAAQPALPSLLPLLKSPDPELRAAVSNAAVRINPAAFRSEPE
jgi:hypothetical protein